MSSDMSYDISVNRAPDLNGDFLVAVLALYV